MKIVYPKSKLASKYNQKRSGPKRTVDAAVKCSNKFSLCLTPAFLGERPDGFERFESRGLGDAVLRLHPGPSESQQTIGQRGADDDQVYKNRNRGEEAEGKKNEEEDEGEEPFHEGEEEEREGGAQLGEERSQIDDGFSGRFNAGLEAV